MSHRTPEGWLAGHLGEFLELKRGYDLPKRTRRDGPFPIVSSSGPSGTHADAKVKGPGVVTGRYGTIGRVFFVEGDYWPLNTSLYVCDFKGSDPRFISYFLRCVDFQKYVDKAAVPGVNRNHVHLERVAIPPLDEQRRIAAILGALDDKIELNRRMNATLEEMAQAIFKSWFIDFDGHDDLVESEIGPVPRGWEVVPVSECVAEIETGTRPKGGVAGYAEGLPSIGAESIDGVGVFDFSKTKFVPHEFFKRLSRGVLKDRDVLLYKDGGKPGDFRPKVGMFGDGYPFDECSLNSHVYRLRLRAPFTQEFGYFWFSSAPVMDEMRRRGTGVAVPSLSRRNLLSMPMLVPTDVAVRSFGTIAEPVVARILTAAKESRALAELRDTLLPKLISGEIRVPTAEEAVEAVL